MTEARRVQPQQRSFVLNRVAYGKERLVITRFVARKDVARALAELDAGKAPSWGRAAHGAGTLTMPWQVHLSAEAAAALREATPSSAARVGKALDQLAR